MRREEADAVDPRNRFHASNERGSAMLVAMLVLFVIVTIGFASSQVATTEVELAGNYAQSWKAFYAADGAAQASFNDLVDVARSIGQHPDEGELSALSHQSIDGVAFTEFLMQPTDVASDRPLSTGFYQGLVASTRPYEVTLTADTSSYPKASAGVTMGMFFDIIPIFQFAVFYEHDLELFPGPPMTLSGRVHSNGDMYLGAGNSLTIDSNVTTAGDLFNMRKDDGSRPGGSTRIRNGLGDHPAMSGLDSRDADWVDLSLERWRGNVRSAAHGVERLNLTISDPSNPHMIIEPGYDSDTPRDRTAKLFYNAAMSINILNGQGFDPDGNKLDLGTAIGFDILFDQREQRDMLVVELDLVQLATVPEFPAPGEPATIYIGSFEPGNGIPEWEITGSGGSGLGFPWTGGTAAEFLEAFIDSCPPFVCGLVQAAKETLENAKIACETLSGQRRIRTANRLARLSVRHLWNAVDEVEGFEAEYADAIEDVAQKVGSCDMSSWDEDIDIDVPEGSEETVDWPEDWDSYLPPYEGGDTEFAVKIKNGATLSNPLTIVTANPAYIQGDYNVIDKKPASVLADAITILSNAWSDADDAHSRLPLDQRNATDTAMNVALMLGNTETTRGNYNGGVENLPRFLERWSGRTFRYRGSLIDLWYSRNATGAWRYGSPVYTAPNRDWEFDSDFSNPASLPPSTPRVYTLRMREWTRH